ncbi:MAG TPA: hypothetical protein PKJ77_07320 [Thermodesulfobacteriota bacterium]|nr:hypothetical protein [Deltaproteobacteria bacterium]HOC39070.1 hypothetical protein [Thermodesulfobacteriota bacterium]
MLDVAVSYNRYKFLGHEFLTWLWYVSEKHPELIKNKKEEPVSLTIGNRMVLENKNKEAVETITITGDDAGLEEGILALRKGAIVTDLNLMCKEGEKEWRFNLKGESLGLSGLRCPSTAPVENEEDVEGAVLEKTYLLDQVIQLVDVLYREFISLRVSPAWNKQVMPAMKKWIANR